MIVFMPVSEEWVANGNGIYHESLKWLNVCDHMYRWLPSIEEYLEINKCKLPFLSLVRFTLKDDKRM